MSTPGYIKAIGDPDYNFGYNDFTVEFFSEALSNVVLPNPYIDNPSQTFFEITNAGSPASNSYIKTRLLTVLNNDNIKTFAIQSYPSIVAAGSNTFVNPTTSNISNIQVFLGGYLLNPNDDFYISRGNIYLTSNVNNIISDTFVEIGENLFSINGKFSTNKSHYVSIERKNNNMYLFVDGISQDVAKPMYNSIPSQFIVNSLPPYDQLSKISDPAQLTIGANKDGVSGFVGKFGDFRITNGFARHVCESHTKNIISSNFTDSLTGNANINIEGGYFVDSYSSYAPEELVPSQIFDSLNLSVYQNANCANLSSNVANLQSISTNIPNPAFNANSTILGFRIFKDTISIGAIGEYNIHVGDSPSGIFPVPWNQVDVDAGSVTVNGNVATSDTWIIKNNQLLITGVPANSNINITLTGPVTYYSIGASAVSTITSNLYATDSSISVSNVAGFPTPNVYTSTRGVTFINGERITYLYIDRVSNVLSGLTRGTLGTGTPNVHIANSQIISASYDREFPGNPGEVIWYNAVNANLAAANSAISNFLVNQGTKPPA